jgi:hypothetical protein
VRATLGTSIGEQNDMNRRRNFVSPCATRRQVLALLGAGPTTLVALRDRQARAAGVPGLQTDCTGRLFPADNIWNTPIADLPVDPNSAAYVDAIGPEEGLHPDFGSGLYEGETLGIPYTTVDDSQPLFSITFDYADESDPGPYPIPANAPIEGGPTSTGDRHVIVIDTIAWKLYETYDSHPLNGGTSWHAGSGATWDLSSNALRPAGWTSADAAGLPIFPGLVRYDEAVIRGAINHALRFTCPTTRKAYISPARHWASSQKSANYMPMGARVRLKADVDISTYPAEVRVILTAMKKYGMFLADNGSGMYVSGAPDPRWSDDNLATLGRLTASNFEVVKMGTVVVP